MALSSQLSRFIDNLPGLGFVKDKHCRYVHANPYFLSSFGHELKDVIGKTDDDWLPPDLAEACRASDAHALSGDAPYQGVESFKTGEGVTYYLVTKFRLGEADDRLLAGIAFDITQQKEAEQALARAKDKAISASQIKSTFIAQMSHEIRTPLNAIIGFADLLDSNAVSPTERRAYLEIIRRNGRELARLVDDSLDLAKVEANRLELRLQTVDLDDLLGEIAASLGQMARSKGLVLDISRQSTAPKHIETDPARLRQVLVNIIGNAVKFTDAGTIDVMVSADQNAKLTKFVVRDSGKGIAFSEQNWLFRPFSQVPGTMRGTGLGLALSRELARALGGDVTLERSEPGRGSTFAIRVATRHPSLGESCAPSPTAPKVACHDASPCLSGLSVLVIDDSPENQMLVTRCLELAGASVAVADSGTRGIEFALNAAFDVVLMDVQMPDISGLDATRELRRLGYSRPIIALTAHAMPEERENCLDAGCDDHLPKPITRDHLLRTLARYHKPSLAAKMGRAEPSFTTAH